MLSKKLSKSGRLKNPLLKTRYKSYKRAKKRLKWKNSLEKETFLPFDLIKWKVYDIYKAMKDTEKKPHYYGIRMFCGLYGQGKTMSMIKYLDAIRRKHGDKVIISTNFFYVDEDFRLENWKQMCDTYEKTVIFAIDEVQNEFNSRDYRNFPHSLITLLTQNRKGNGVQVISSAQRFDHVDKVFRDLCEYVYECKTLFGRLTITRRYLHHDYQQLNKMVSVDRKRKIPKETDYYIQTDRLRGLYDSYKMIDTAKKKLQQDEPKSDSKKKTK